MAAIASDGVLGPMPPSVDLPESRVMVPPTDRATLLDGVVPSDSMTVITAWERAQRLGVAVATVRTRTNPDTELGLTFIDLRDDHGGLIGALDVLEHDEVAEGPLSAATVTVSRRPRTGTR